MFEADMGRFVFTVSIPADWEDDFVFRDHLCGSVILMDTVLIMKTRLIELLLSKKKNEKVHLKNPVICCIIFVAACIMLGTAYYNVTAEQLDTEAEVMITDPAWNCRNISGLLVRQWCFVSDHEKVFRDLL